MKAKLGKETFSTKTFVIADSSETKLSIVRRKTSWAIELASNKKKLVLKIDKTLSGAGQDSLIDGIRSFLDVGSEDINLPKRAITDATYSIFSWVMQVVGRVVADEINAGTMTAKHPYILVSYDDNEGRVKVGLYLKSKFQGFVGSSELRAWLLIYSDAVIYQSVGCEILEKQMIARERLISPTQDSSSNQDKVISTLMRRSYYWYVLIERQARVFGKEFWEKEGAIVTPLNYEVLDKGIDKLSTYSDPKKRLFSSNLCRETTIEVTTNPLDIKIYRSANSWVVALSFLEQKHRLEMALTMANESQKLFGAALGDWLNPLTNNDYKSVLSAFSWIERTISEFLLEGLHAGDIGAEHPYIRCETRCTQHNIDRMTTCAYKNNNRVGVLSSTEVLEFLLDNPSTVIYSNKTSQAIEQQHLFSDTAVMQGFHPSQSHKADVESPVRAQYWADSIWAQEQGTGKRLWSKSGNHYDARTNNIGEESEQVGVTCDCEWIDYCE